MQKLLNKFWPKSKAVLNTRSQLGFSLIEIMIVIAIIGTLYVVAIPQFNIVTGADRETKLGRLVSDIRAAFDEAVLSGYPHRLVFNFGNGSYHLEIADRRILPSNNQKLGRDPTAEEEKIAAEEFIEMIKQYQDLAGEEVKSLTGEVNIKPTSPLLEQKHKLAPVQWTIVQEGEWNIREMGSSLLIFSIQAEHHESKLLMSELGPEDRGMIYFFPNGYVEKAVIQIADADGGVPDSSKPLVNIVTKPLEGDAEVTTQNIEINFDENVGS